MTLLKFLFWFSFFVIIYSYIGYGILIFLLVQAKKLFKNRENHEQELFFEPDITMVVAAFNEEDFIDKKIENSLALDYPPDKLKLIFITDGSTDNTPAIIERFANIQLLHQPERRGKVAAMNRAIHFVSTDYVIFSDANTLLNKECVREMVKHYKNPSVGGVAGEKKIIATSNEQAAGVGEGLYWKYESFLKKMDAEFYSVIGAAGELISVRTSLFENVGDDVVIEDFVQSLKICMKGYTIQYEPNAFAMESSSLSMKEEEKRKVRICAGAFQAMVILKNLFNVFKYPVLSFQFISHRILRWTLCPLCIVFLLLSNALIVFENQTTFYAIFLVLQLCFYSLAVIGWRYAHKNITVKALYLPYYFLFMNISVYLGFYKFIRKKQPVLWEKASRRNDYNTTK
jgi:cellulose synthase/poly-beta-1,6-N-acetylglucosamine synthase-like glycosyltransferase